MARDGLSRKDVFDAIERLTKENKNVTIENIRRLLGSGSNTTISKYKKEFYQNKISKKLNKKYADYHDGYADALKKVLAFVRSIL